MSQPKRMTHEQWVAEGKRRFGDNVMAWRFVCPVCKYVASIQDWKDAGAPEGQVAFSCIGRMREESRQAFEESGDGPCNYAGGGLFRLNPVHVSRVNDTGEEEIYQVFDFAEQTP